jgi:hypothetical protein
VLFAREDIGQGLGTWRRAAAAVTHPVVSERERERERERESARGVKVTDAAAAAAQLGPDLGRGRIDLD